MVMHVALNHRTTYRYDRAVGVGPQVIRLRPAPHCRTRVLSYSLTVKPTRHFLNWQQDPHGNWLARFVFPEPASELEIEVDLVAEMAVLNPFDFFLEPTAERWPFAYERLLRKDLDPYLEHPPAGPRLSGWLAGVSRELTPTVDFLVGLNQRLARETSYLIRMEPGIQTPEATLELASGSCRDSAWLMVQILRNLGLAARFVSGYLIQLKPDVQALDGPSGTHADFTDLHAWAEVFLPGAGWVGFDPTSGLLAGEGHLPLAATPDPENAAPITGAVDPCEVSFDYAMTARRIFEQPRVTKPYTDEQWQEVLAAGRAVDAQLLAEDVRLTVGGEPTFVAIDYRDAEEWNIAATGPAKQVRADDLIRRLRDRFAPGGLIHYGQGKWYPGEVLPRWAFAVYWRQDGQPLWRHPELVPDRASSAPPRIAHAERFALAVAQRLGVDSEAVVPAFEDPAYFVQREHLLPENVDPTSSGLDDPQERARLARVFDRGLDQPVGFALPLQSWQARDGRVHWTSERWSTRRPQLFLTPGDSALGYRLPLASLPQLASGDYPQIHPADPFAAQAALPARLPVMQLHRPAAGAAMDVPGPSGAVRTALAIEPRDGHLYAFLPPTQSAAEFVDLVQAIEETAAELSHPIRLEGYAPPPDARLHVIKVTPDPGVIEVNIQPSASWDEQVAITEALYEEARLARLDACKFMIDGRQVGTGGGNHVVLGGPTAADSPFLRRPDLLASLVTYWQNHPSLSYLFSGLFIGPTSQAPRIDEARQDHLYELEIALAQVPAPGGTPRPPWLVNRLFRDLLIDVTGNTHRAEICIDKLYSPDGPSGRLGLVEFRAFEMPPHARMSLAQQLVLRALIAWFWRTPYRRPLSRLGTTLHDRFMLPHYVWQDFVEVLVEIREQGGIALDPTWYASHFEFRFPLYGHLRHGDLDLELRAALEPWHVMGEEGMIGGTVRYVDSSVERLQVKVAGGLGERWAVTCNRRELPLATAGDRETRVAGVRFRAWQPPHCLHPTIGVHAPLVFDIVDRWNGRSVAGCTYHVVHPGGRSFDTLPVNDLEAEGRRLARFQPSGHTPGPLTPLPPVPNPEFPHTLDLRRFG